MKTTVRPCAARLRCVCAARPGARVVAHRIRVAVHHVIVEAVLERARAVRAEHPPDVGFVLAEQPVHGRRPLPCPRGHDDRFASVQTPGHARFAARRPGAQRGLAGGLVPRPRITRPEQRQHIERRGLVRAVFDGHAHHDVIGGVLGVFDLDIEIKRIVEDAGVEYFVLGQIRAALRVFPDQVVVGKGAVRVFVEHPHV